VMLVPISVVIVGCDCDISIQRVISVCPVLFHAAVSGN